jgi:predicted Rossmann-fold nucleotide-binding protein
VESYDLVTPDGKITKLENEIATVLIEGISPDFAGFDVEPVVFNLKSTLAQIGIHGIGRQLHLDRKKRAAEIKVELMGIGPLGKAMLKELKVGSYIGKLFAKDPKRMVRNPYYLMRMLGRTDEQGRPLLSLGSESVALEKIEGRTVAFISLLEGAVSYDEEIFSFLPTLARALKQNIPNTRKLLSLYQHLHKKLPRVVQQGELLLVKTAPLHIRTVYGHVVEELLPKGVHHTSANFLQPDTADSGDIYELFGSHPKPIERIPLEFYTLEPYREHVFFEDRDQLIAALDDPKALFDAFKTAPGSDQVLASVFVVKGTQLKSLQPKDWVAREPYKHEFPGLAHPEKQAQVAEQYVEHQPSYPFLRAIEEGSIASQGILLTRHFPTPLLKKVLLDQRVTRCLKRIYFRHPSCAHGDYFSHEDRAMLIDLAKFGIPVYWVDEQILQYVLKPEKDVGLFVPLHLVETFRKSTVFGVYGSNLIEGNFEQELKVLMQGVLKLMPHTPIALLTGGGPGAMEVGNRVAKSLGILSCANILDFRLHDRSVVNEQKPNPYIDAKMTYRLDRLVERQAEFSLDFPIFLPGGMGMDFEYALEEVRRKTGSAPPTPCLLFGEPEYWRRKVGPRFRLNEETGTIKGSEWVSNCFYCIQTGEQGLKILKQFLEGTLPIGKEGPVYPDGLKTVV